MTGHFLMLNDWFQPLRFQTDWETFQQLPRHPAYRYEYRDGHSLISGRPVFYHAQLDLRQFLSSTDVNEESSVVCSSLQAVDWNEFTPLFAAAFARTAPFMHLSESNRNKAATALLERTRQQLDGPVQPAASQVIRSRTNGELLGAILVTLIPNADLTDFTDKTWANPPPPDAVESGWGHPHLTWVFVHPSAARSGIGQRLLYASAQSLDDLGYTQLKSTFLIGNAASVLWHWKNYFQLLPHVSSRI